MIALSQIISQVPQADGRIDVTEHHTYADGHVYVVNYLANSDMDLQAIAAARAANINAELERRAAELAAATSFEIPLMMSDIIKRVALIPGALNALYSSTVPEVVTARIVFDKWQAPIYRGDVLTQTMFGIIQAAGILTAEQIAEVLA